MSSLIFLQLSNEEKKISEPKFVRPRLIGRLGNQLFILATAIAYAIDTNREILLDSLANVEEYNLQSAFTLVPFKRDCSVEKPSNKEITELSFNYCKLDRSHITDIVTLHGYFQSPKYFDHHRSLLLKYFTPSQSIQQKVDRLIQRFRSNFFGRTRLVSIHVRRGDYLHLDNIYTNLTMRYYDSAMKIFLLPNSADENKNLVFVVFSDDANWCKTQFISFPNVIVVDFEFGAVETLFAMSQCDDHIIANSSLSWWGAYLNQNFLGATVVAPAVWFAKDGPQNWQDVYCLNWILLDNNGERHHGR